MYSDRTASSDIKYLFNDVISNHGIDLIHEKSPIVTSVPFGFSINPYASGVVVFGESYAGVSLSENRKMIPNSENHVDRLNDIVEALAEHDEKVQEALLIGGGLRQHKDLAAYFTDIEVPVVATFADYSKHTKRVDRNSFLASSFLVIPQVNYAFMHHKKLGYVDISCNFSNEAGNGLEVSQNYRIRH